MWTNGGTMFHEWQSTVSAGYSVLALNPIGSQGYGQDYSQLIVPAKWGLDDARDPKIRDHLGNQFDYLGELFARAANDDYPETYTGLARNFMQKHLVWTGPFLAKVEARAETGFYRGLARVTRSFLDQ